MAFKGHRVAIQLATALEGHRTQLGNASFLSARETTSRAFFNLATFWGLHFGI